MMVPAKTVFVPRVALLPTCQKTLAACAPLIKTTWLLFAAVIRVDPIWKIKTAFEFPWPSKVTRPVIPSEVGSV
jgi:hypothetical protein